MVDWSWLILLQDVTRTFNDILDFYSVYGIDGGKGENEDELDNETDEFFMVSDSVRCMLFLQ